MSFAETFEELDDQALERRLLELGFATGIPGRVLESQKSAIRTVLKRRSDRQRETDVDEEVRQAVELVNACRRGRRERVTIEDIDAGIALVVLLAVPCRASRRPEGASLTPRVPVDGRFLPGRCRSHEPQEGGTE